MQGYNFTTRVRRALQNARAEASRLGHEYVGTEHILLGVLMDTESIATAAIKSLSVGPDALRQRIVETTKPGTAEPQELRKLPYTSRAKRILELAMLEARDQQLGYVSTEHLLLGTIREERGIAAQVLNDAGVTLEAARREVARITRERGIEPPPVEGEVDAPDVLPAGTMRPDASETWQAMMQHAGFIALWWVLGLILFLGGTNAVVDYATGTPRPHWFIVLLTVLQVVGAVLFLVPRTLRLGGKVLLTTLLLAFASYAVQGEYIARMLVYAAATFMILTLQSKMLGARNRRADP